MRKINKIYLSVFIMLTALLSGCTKDNTNITAEDSSTQEAESMPVLEPTESAPVSEPEQSDLTIELRERI